MRRVPPHTLFSHRAHAMKVPKACRQCREGRRKCVRENLGESCIPCKKRNLVCAGKLRPKNTVAPVLPKPALGEVGGNPSGAAIVGLTEEVVVELVELYLDRIHDRPHSLFHPSTLRAQVRSGTVGKALLYAICSIGSRFSKNAETRQMETQLTLESKRLLQANLEHVCIENIQTSILIAMLSAAHCNPSSEALFFRK